MRKIGFCKRERLENVKKSKMFMVDFFLMLFVLLLDQFTKYMAIVKLQNKPSFVIVEGVLELTYLENRGSAFGMFENKKIMILFVGILFMTCIFAFLVRIPEKRKFCSLHILFTMIIAGGIGNMIDRLRLGYVVDFISFVLIHYPIFNVADIFIVCGTISLFLLFALYYTDQDLEFLSFKKKS